MEAAAHGKEYWQLLNQDGTDMVVFCVNDGNYKPIIDWSKHHSYTHLEFRFASVVLFTYFHIWYISAAAMNPISSIAMTYIAARMGIRWRWISTLEKISISSEIGNLSRFNPTYFAQNYMSLNTWAAPQDCGKLPVSQDILSTMVSSKNRKQGCESCKKRHMKCDGISPCSQCTKKNLVCQRPLRVRLVKINEPEPVYVPNTKRKRQDNNSTIRRRRHEVTFIDQSLEVERSYNDETTNEATSGPTDIHWINETHVLHTSNNVLDLISTDSSSLSPHLVPSSICPTYLSTDDIDSTIGNPVENRAYCQQSLLSELQPSERPERQRADCIQRFLEQLGPALDPWDEARRFASNLVEEALECPTLMQSIVLLVETYGNSCTSTEQHSVDALLMAAAVNDMSHRTIQSTCITLLLNVIEIMQGNFATAITINLVPKLQDMTIWCHESQLGHRVLEYELFWGGIWVEVYVAVMYQRPFTSPLNTRHIHQFIRNGHDDRSWTNQMLMHLVDIIAYCFGSERSRRVYDGLQAKTNMWEMNKPACFEPVSKHFLNQSNFPHIWFLNDTIAAGMQYFHLSKILLLAHDPSMPLVGAAMKNMKRERDILIREQVQTICGIAQSLNKNHPANLPASMAISLVGDRFTEREEQMKLLSVLKQTEKSFGWSTSIAQRHLRESWGLMV